MALKPGPGLEKWELATTKKLVTEFRRRSRILERHDFDDLVQECLAHWIGVRNKVDIDLPSPPVAFMATVLRNMLMDWIREQGAEKRSGDLGLLSLDATLDGTEDGPSLADALAESDAAGSVDHGGSFADMRMDLLRALPMLTAPQQRLCVLLGHEGLSIKEAAERMRIPRGTLYAEVKRIRELFAHHGLDVYLKE
jgi:RNA polymerase sigma factor (sigma-70 family)